LLINFALIPDPYQDHIACQGQCDKLALSCCYAIDNECWKNRIFYIRSDGITLNIIRGLSGRIRHWKCPIRFKVIPSGSILRIRFFRQRHGTSGRLTWCFDACRSANSLLTTRNLCIQCSWTFYLCLEQANRVAAMFESAYLTMFDA